MIRDPLIVGELSDSHVVAVVQSLTKMGCRRSSSMLRRFGREASRSADFNFVIRKAR